MSLFPSYRHCLAKKLTDWSKPQQILPSVSFKLPQHVPTNKYDGSHNYTYNLFDGVRPQPMARWFPVLG